MIIVFSEKGFRSAELFLILIPQILRYKIYFDPAGMAASPCDDDLITEAVRCQTVMAMARCGTGDFFV